MVNDISNPDAPHTHIGTQSNFQMSQDGVSSQHFPRKGRL